MNRLLKTGLDRVFRGTQISRELDAAAPAHLVSGARNRTEGGGGRPAAAPDAAGALSQEATRGAGGRLWIEGVWQDVRYALRGMRRNRGFTAVAVLSLGLGIGANVAIFSVVRALMLRTLPVRDPGQLVELLFKAPGQDHFNSFEWRSYEHYRDGNHVFSGLIASTHTPFGLYGQGLEPEVVRGGYVSTNYFSVLGIRPAMGRLIGPEDDRSGAPAGVAVVSWSYWKTRLNSDPAVAGRQITDGAGLLTIVGVAPKGFVGLEPGKPQDIWRPLCAQHPASANWAKLAARLKPGVSIQQARAEMAVLFAWTEEDQFKRNDDRSVYDARIEVQSAATGLSHLRDQLGNPVLVLMTVAALLLMIACANIAGLLLARGAARRHEMAIRVSIGADRLRLLRQQFTECVLLGVCGAVPGVFLAYWGSDALVRIMKSGRDQIELQVRPDLVVLLFTAAVAVFTGILFGLAPAWQTFRSAPAASLRVSTGSAEARRGWLLSRSLVVVQVAFSVALLSATGLFVRHLASLQRLSLGFQRDHVLLVDLNATSSGYSRQQLSRAYEELLGRLEAVPGVRSATACGFYPMSGVGAMRPANVEGYQAKAGERRFLSQNWVAPKYFATFGIPLLMGRDFSFQDVGRPRVAIVNRTMVRYFFGDGNPIGKHVTFDGDSEPFEIVGVVGDAKSADMREPALRFVYFNSFQAGVNNSHFALRTSVEPQAVASDVRRVVRALLKTVAVERVKTLGDQVDGAIVPERLSAILSGLFGGLGALLAAVGLYGLLAYKVAQRTREIGVRIAIGATRADITKMVLYDALGMTCAGLLVGGLIAHWGNRLVVSLMPSLPAQTVFPALFGAAVMVALAIVSAWVPARRATRVDPIAAVRCE